MFTQVYTMHLSTKSTAIYIAFLLSRWWYTFLITEMTAYSFKDVLRNDPRCLWLLLALHWHTLSSRKLSAELQANRKLALFPFKNSVKWAYIYSNQQFTLFQGLYADYVIKHGVMLDASPFKTYFPIRAHHIYTYNVYTFPLLSTYYFIWRVHHMCPC